MNYLLIVQPVEHELVVGSPLLHIVDHGGDQGDVRQGIDGGGELEIQPGGDAGTLQTEVVEAMNGVSGGEGGDLHDVRLGLRLGQLPGPEALPRVFQSLNESLFLPVSREMLILSSCCITLSQSLE